MTSNTSDKLFTAKDIEKYIGINANTLYHWVQVRGFIKPAIEGYGRGKAHKFDMDNLATLLLTKVLLQSWKIELRSLGSLYELIISADKGETNIWRKYKKKPKEHRKNGYYMIAYLDSIGTGKVGIGSYHQLERKIYLMRKGGEGRVIGPLKNGERIRFKTLGLIVIDLIGVIEEIEQRVGVEF